MFNVGLESKVRGSGKEALLSASSVILSQRGSDSDRQMHMPFHSPQAIAVLNRC